ncbi:uncharacterized protein LOC112568346 isoform X3 [Pomacea canaliculata]|uniref:uncharacterized protein LOC112568346 isoform X3 n=1 Tax=Pomacea canaliculata TaxID=400727 RepID=UPI000D73C344|nr:uncharacterized protein LOC112568346 isoform X3 [Pomacea canaliculata]
MGRTSFSCVCMILAIMRGTVYCRPTCSVLEFPEVIENIVQARVNESVTIRFSLNTESCSSVPDEFNIKVTQKVNNRVTQVCRIRLKGGKCTLSDTSSTCYCPSSTGEMLFLKRVTKADDGLYTWTWSEQLSGDNEKKITLRVIEENKPRSNDTQVPQVSTPVPDDKPSKEKVTPVPDAERSLDRMSPVPDGERLPDKVTPVPDGGGSRDRMTTAPDGQVSRVTPVSEEERRRHPLSPGSHRDKKTEGPDPKHQESDSILPDMTRAVHQKDADGGLDIKLIVIGAIFVGVVLVVVIAGALIYLIRGQRRLREAHRAGGVSTACSSPQAPPPPADSREQTIPKVATSHEL